MLVRYLRQIINGTDVPILSIIMFQQYIISILINKCIQKNHSSKKRSWSPFSIAGHSSLKLMVPSSPFFSSIMSFLKDFSIPTVRPPETGMPLRKMYTRLVLEILPVITLMPGTITASCPFFLAFIWNRSATSQAPLSMPLIDFSLFSNEASLMSFSRVWISLWVLGMTPSVTASLAAGLTSQAQVNIWAQQVAAYSTSLTVTSPISVLIKFSFTLVYCYIWGFKVSSCINIVYSIPRSPNLMMKFRLSALSPVFLRYSDTNFLCSYSFTSSSRIAQSITGFPYFCLSSQICFVSFYSSSANLFIHTSLTPRQNALFYFLPYLDFSKLSLAAFMVGAFFSALVDSNCVAIFLSSINLAFFSFSTSYIWSPGAGIKGIPTIWMASPGSAYFSDQPRSSRIVLTLKDQVPMTRLEPILSVPFSIMIVMELRPYLVLKAQRTLASARPLKTAVFYLVQSTISSQSSYTFSPVFALICTTGILPSSLSGMITFRPAFFSYFQTVSGSASGKSILLIATMIGMSIFLISSMTSRVCFFTPSTPDTTRTTRSVTVAPRCLMLVNASWPGVSMKLILSPLQVILKALILWVMPPSYFWAMSELRRQSMSVVLPWSTCPMMVTTACFLRMSGSKLLYFCSLAILAVYGTTSLLFLSAREGLSPVAGAFRGTPGGLGAKLAGFTFVNSMHSLGLHTLLNSSAFILATIYFITYTEVESNHAGQFYQ